MAKFYGPIGYGESVESVPGVWQDVITEVNAYGEVTTNSRTLEQGANVNDDITTGNSISIVMDAYSSEHFFAMRYISWLGTLWIVQNVLVQRPRLILRLGGVYNGPRPE